MKIAYFSPLNPVRTGISDYSEELLPYLARHFEIDVYIAPGYKPENERLSARFPILAFNPDEFRPEAYSAIVYHMGNYYEGHAYIYEALKRFPGIVVLHDYALQGFYAERYAATGDFGQYRDLLVRTYSEKGAEIAAEIQAGRPLPIWESDEAFDYPLNEEVASFARALIVHSDFVRLRLQGLSGKPVVTIPHHGHAVRSHDLKAARSRLGVGDGELLILSAGYINKNKRYDRILAALNDLKDLPFKYLITGEDRGGLLRNYVDPLDARIKILGRLPLPELEAAISAADICINLRFPTMGESSGSLIRMMGLGKSVLVTNYGSYAEFPDHCVLKVDPDVDEVEMIRRFTRELALDSDFRASVGREARSFVEKEHGLEKCADSYARVIRETGRPLPGIAGGKGL